MKLRRAIPAIVLVVVLVGVVKALLFGRTAMSPMEVAYNECGPCELTHAEVDALIDDLQHSTLTREQNREMFIATFEDRAHAAECLPCADAILYASELP